MMMMRVVKSDNGYYTLVRCQNDVTLALDSGSYVRFETDAEARKFAEWHGYEVEARARCKVDRLGPCFFGLSNIENGVMLNAFGKLRDVEADEPFVAFFARERAIKFAEAHGWEVSE
jgi:hypothetical protein